MDGRTESDAYEPTMQYEQVGSEIEENKRLCRTVSLGELEVVRMKHPENYVDSAIRHVALGLCELAALPAGLYDPAPNLF